MQGDIDRDEMDGVVIVSHVNSKAGCWEVLHVVHVKDPCEGDLFVSYFSRQQCSQTKSAQTQTFGELENLQGLADGGQLASFNGNGPNGFGMRVSHLVGGGLLLQAVDDMVESIYPLTHFGPGVSTHDLLEKVVGED